MTTEPRPFDACPACNSSGVLPTPIDRYWAGNVASPPEPCDCIRRRATVPADIAQTAANEFHRVNEQDGTTWADAIESALQVALAMLPEQSVWVERVDPKTPALLAAVDNVLGDGWATWEAHEHLREVRRDLSTAPAVEGVTVIDGRVFEVRPVAGVGPNGSNCAFLRPVKEAS